MLALLAVAARLRRGVSMIAASAVMTSTAMAQQYPPFAYPNPGQSPGIPAPTPGGLSRPGIWGARCSPTASARGGPASTERHYGLATWILELEETRLGLGVRLLRLPFRTRARIGFLVIGANDTAAGFGRPGTGDDIRHRWSHCRFP